MRRLVPAVLLALLLSCGRLTTGGSAAGPSPVDARRIGIYEAAVRGMVATESWYDPIFIDEWICEGAGDPAGQEMCTERFGEAEQGALLEALADLPSVRLVADADRIVDRIFGGEVEGGALIRVGPISGDGDRVEVPASAYCGGLCGHWMTLVVERSGDTWEVTGTTGPIGIA